MKSSSILISILTVTTVIAGVAAYNTNSANEEHKKDNVALNELNFQLAGELETLKGQLSKYQQELENTKTALASLNKELFELKRASVSSEDKSIPILQTNQIETIEPVVTEKESDIDSLLAFAKRIKNGESIKSIEDNAREQFYEEEVDGSWAYEYEANIRDLIAEDENNSFNIQELNCKTSACELKITANENNAMILGTLFSKTLGEQEWRDKSASVIFNHEVKDGVMSILIGRDKNSFN